MNRSLVQFLCICIFWSVYLYGVKIIVRYSIMITVISLLNGCGCMLGNTALMSYSRKNFAHFAIFCTLIVASGQWIHVSFYWPIYFVICFWINAPPEVYIFNLVGLVSGTTLLQSFQYFRFINWIAQFFQLLFFCTMKVKWGEKNACVMITSLLCKIMVIIHQLPDFHCEIIFFFIVALKAKCKW